MRTFGDLYFGLCVFEHNGAGGGSRAFSWLAKWVATVDKLDTILTIWNDWKHFEISLNQDATRRSVMRTVIIIKVKIT